MAKILVADDNSNIQKMVGLALKDQGIDVIAVGNGEAAVRKISDIKPDLVLADVFMPVRNGYEVCRYVKEDAALAHIPVILLVGAFDPLDEQEAQRSGADGVLKKPFVPPDPLISMVKSALLRAGVPLGNAHPAEKTPPPPKRSSADILNAGVSSKLAALSAEKLPEAAAEPIEEFPTLPSQVKIAAGTGPLAFGSLMETPETEEEPVLTAKPMIELTEARNWDDEPDEVQEEPEESDEAPHTGGWHPGGLDEAVEKVATSSTPAPDWREEAFHGNSPAKSLSSKRWAPSLERPTVVEAAGSPSATASSVAVKQEDAPIPFSGDAWAAAMAAGVEEKLSAVKDIAATTPIAQPMGQVKEISAREFAEPSLPTIEEAAAAVSAQAAEESHPAEPANWAAVPETPWETEAKKASLLASTWDAPKMPAIDETQEVPVYGSAVPSAPAEAPVESSAYSGSESAFVATEHVETPAQDSVHESVIQASSPLSLQNAWEAPATTQPAPNAPAEASTPAETALPDMDEIVARVLGKMSPEVLQRVTREILKPVIEAIVRDEINSKKS